MIGQMFLYAIVLALLLALAFAGFRRSNQWQHFWLFLFLLFLGLFSAALWLPPVGPVWYGVAWLELLLVGLVLALLISAAGRRPSGKEDYARDEEGEIDLVAESKKEPGALQFSRATVWVLVALLLGSIIAGLVRRGVML